jgi:hypothetical protein
VVQVVPEEQVVVPQVQVVVEQVDTPVREEQEHKVQVVQV